MARVKTAPASRRRKKRVLKSVKGAWGGRSKLYRRAKETLQRSLAYSYRDRKNKKRSFRRLWIVRINAAAREAGLTYSQFMRGIEKAGVKFNRKTLADLAAGDPETFKKLVDIARSD
jgi:large subunit ribosomal protein L20